MNSDVVTTALYSVLSADVTLLGDLPGGIWSVRPPSGTVLPYMRLQLMPSPLESWTLGGQRVVRLRYQVSVAVKGFSLAPGETALARADTLLSDGTFTTTEGAVLSCRREGFPGHTSEEVEGVPYQLVRANYLVVAA